MKGKIMGLGALGMFQMVFYLVVGLSVTYYKGWATIDLPQIPFFIIFLKTGYFFYAAFFVVLGTFFIFEK